MVTLVYGIPGLLEPAAPIAVLHVIAMWDQQRRGRDNLLNEEGFVRDERASRIFACSKHEYF